MTLGGISVAPRHGLQSTVQVFHAESLSISRVPGGKVVPRGHHCGTVPLRHLRPTSPQFHAGEVTQTLISFDGFLEWRLGARRQQGVVNKQVWSLSLRCFLSDGDTARSKAPLLCPAPNTRSGARKESGRVMGGCHAAATWSPGSSRSRGWRGERDRQKGREVLALIPAAVGDRRYQVEQHDGFPEKVTQITSFMGEENKNSTCTQNPITRLV